MVARTKRKAAAGHGIWVTGEGREIPLYEMANSHLENVAAKLRKWVASEPARADLAEKLSMIEGEQERRLERDWTRGQEDS